MKCYNEIIVTIQRSVCKHGLLFTRDARFACGVQYGCEVNYGNFLSEFKHYVHIGVARCIRGRKATFTTIHTRDNKVDE